MRHDSPRPRATAGGTGTGSPSGTGIGSRPHCARTNTSKRYRISCDTRWQPAAEAADERWSTEEGWRRQLDPARLKERGEEGATEVRK